MRRLLKDVDEAVRLLVEVQELDNAVDGLDGVEQLEFEGHASALVAAPLQHLVPGHVLDGHVGAVTCPHARVHGAEASLAEHLAHLVRLLETLPLVSVLH